MPTTWVTKWNPEEFDWSDWDAGGWDRILLTRRERFHLTKKVKPGDRLLIYGGAQSDVFIHVGWVVSAPGWHTQTPNRLWADGFAPAAWWFDLVFPKRLKRDVKLRADVHEAVRAKGQNTFFDANEVGDADEMFESAKRTSNQ